MRETLEILRHTHKPESRQISDAESRLGECLLAQNRPAEAEPLLLQSSEKLKNSLEENHRTTQEA